MNAFNTVNLAAACILTSAENAIKLGVPPEKWVYPLGGAGRKEKERCRSSRPSIFLLQTVADDATKTVWERPNFHYSEAISATLDECLLSAGLGVDELDAVDLYS